MKATGKDLQEWIETAIASGEGDELLLTPGTWVCLDCWGLPQQGTNCCWCGKPAEPGCEVCGGEGGWEEDASSPWQEHYTRRVRCSCQEE